MASSTTSKAAMISGILQFATNPALALALARAGSFRPPQAPARAPQGRPDPEANLGYISRGHDRYWAERTAAEGKAQTQPNYPVLNYAPLGGRIEDGVRYNTKTPTNGQPNPFFGADARRLGGKVRSHWGVDLPADVGSPTYAVNSGTLVEVSKPHGGGYGNSIVLDLGNGFGVRYAHLSDTLGLKVGDKVEGGQLIGRTGRTDIQNAGTNAHLHLELLKGGGDDLKGGARLNGQVRAIDPMPYLGFKR